MFKKQVYLIHFSSPVYWLKVNDSKDLDNGATRQKDPESPHRKLLAEYKDWILCFTVRSYVEYNYICMRKLLYFLFIFFSFIISSPM